MLLMSKDTPVLEIENYNCRIIRKDLLPIALRYDDVNYDDVIHNWGYTRAMDLGKTNAKQIMVACGLKQHNPYIIAQAFHFATLTDSYWIKEKEENISWKDVNLFHNSFDKAVSTAAISGNLPNIVLTGRQIIHSPDPMTKGMAAKTWVRDENNNIWLCKIGFKEIIADEILDVLEIPHLHYEKCSEEEMISLTSKEKYTEIVKSGEWIVKCPIMSSEDKAMVSFEDFAIFCDRNDIDPYEWVATHYPKEYAQMQTADYILANNDRHEENWGLFMDSNTGEIIGFIPLYDHDQILSKDILISQTVDTIDRLMINALADSAEHLDPMFGKKLDKLYKAISDADMKNRIAEVEQIFCDTHSLYAKLEQTAEKAKETNQQKDRVPIKDIVK